MKKPIVSILSLNSILLILSISFMIYGLFFEAGNKKVKNLINKIQKEKTELYCTLYNNSDLSAQKRINALYQPSNLESARCQIYKTKQNIIEALSN